MRLATLLGPDLKDILAKDPSELLEALEEFHPEEIAELLNELPEEDSLALMRALPEDYAAQVLERVPEELQMSILGQLGTEDAATIVTEMSPDDRADIMQELPDDVAGKILAHIEENEPEIAEEVRELVAYPPTSAGGIMTTEYVGLPPEMKVWQAIEEVRRLSREREAENITYIYVIAFGGKLVGVCSLRELILADPGQSLADIMTENVFRIPPTADQEEVARQIAKYDLQAVPIVDEHGRMLGLVTVDDVVDVVIEEATEDAQKMGAVQPIEDPYFDTSIATFIRKRAPWLIILFLGEMLTASVIHEYESVIAAVVELVVFIPLIISSGGNSGSQSSSLIIRALAVGELKPTDWLRVVSREIVIGAFLGIVLGVVGFFRAYFLGQTVDPINIAIVVGTSLVAIVTLGATVGSLLPLLIKRVGLDPAVSSTPFIASLVDVLGLLLYFTVAKLVLGLAL